MLRALPLPSPMSDDSLALLWTCVERREPEAAAAAFWASLPERFGTRERLPGKLPHLAMARPQGCTGPCC
jgi:hypothetical protein